MVALSRSHSPKDAPRAALTLLPCSEGSGDEQTTDLESVYRRHGARVSRWAARLAGPGDIATWLYAITVRVVQARRRRMWKRRWLWPFGGTSRSADGPAPEIADDGISPLDALERRQATLLLYRFLDELDEKYRTSVVLFELEGMSCQEIAIVTGTSVSNVWARVSRGREKLIQAFAKWEAASEASGE
jgi:RNA polymerase sigma factor (sigma-70 family)